MQIMLFRRFRKLCKFYKIAISEQLCILSCSDFFCFLQHFSLLILLFICYYLILGTVLENIFPNFCILAKKIQKMLKKYIKCA